MVKTCSREGMGLRGPSASSSDLMVALSGSTIAAACLACVVWTLTSDHGVESELASEGASRVIKPAAAPLLSPVPDGTLPTASLRLDDGRAGMDKPVVNAHLEIVTGGESASPIVDVSSSFGEIAIDAPRRCEAPREVIGGWLTEAGDRDCPNPREVRRSKAASVH